jgi:myosin-18
VKLKEQINELLQKIESLEGESVTDVVQSRLELKIKELESKLELEQTTRGRMETQVSVLIQCYLTINILYILLNTIAQKTF